MHKIAWAAPVVAGLTVGIPVVAHAASNPAPTNSVTSGTAAVAKGTAAPGSTPLSASPAATPRPTVSPRPAASASPSYAPSATTSRTAASTGQSTQAPPGSAEAYAVRLGDIAAISHTAASASSSGTSSTADPIEIGGKPPASQFGGTQTGPGSSSGALLDTGPGQPLRLALTPWSATNTQSSSSSRASALSDILALDLGNPTTAQSASVRVLQSESDATWTPAASTGSSSSDGAIVDLGGPGGLALDVLHSQTNSSGQGSSYLLSVNGNQIGSSSQANGACVLNVPSLLSLECLTAGGGTAGPLTTATSGVLTATLGSGSASLTANALQSTSSSGRAPSAVRTPSVAAGTGTAPSQSGTAGAPGTGSAAGTGPAALTGTGTAGAASATTGSLPFTGIDALGLIAAAMTLTSAGGLILVSSRRRLRPTA